MFRFRNFLPLAAVLVGAAILAVPRQARADFEIEVSTDGGVNFGAPVSDGGVGDTNGTLGTPNGIIAVNVDGLNITATTSGGTLPSVTLIDLNIISGISTLASTKGIVVRASMDELVTAPPPLVLLNRFTDDSIPAVSTTGETWISAGNSLFTTAGAVLDTGSVAPATALGFTTYGPFSTATPFTVTEQISVGSFGATTGLNIDNNARIMPTPVPPGLLLVLSGLPMLGLGTWLHRRRNRIAA